MSTGYPTPLPARPTNPLSSDARLASYLNDPARSRDGMKMEHPQSSLSTSYPTFPEPQSEGSFADQASVAQYIQGQDPRYANSSSPTTLTSNHGIAPSSARSGSFSDYIQRPYDPASGRGANVGGMVRTNSPSMLIEDGQANNHNTHNMMAKTGERIGPPAAATTSPTYPPHGQCPSYVPQHDIYYQTHPGVHGRPEWAGGQYAPCPPHMAPNYGLRPATSGLVAGEMVSPEQGLPIVSSSACSNKQFRS